MRVIPVIDLQHRQVVRGIAGDRDSYRPIVSRLAGSSDPDQVAQSVVDHFACDEFYVADLDSIAGAAIDRTSLTAIAQHRVKLLVDAGVGGPAKAAELAAYDRTHRCLAGIVVGLETLFEPRQLHDVAEVIAAPQRVFSLDLKHGVLLTRSRGWQGWHPIEVISRAVDEGFSRLIVLDLADVGGGGGPSTGPLCAQVRARFPTVELIAGGGVRNSKDLFQLANAGCDAALVASALHDGRLDPSDLRELAQHGL